MSNKSHKRAWTKVNVQVDEMVVPLIEALGDFPELRTIESCQRNKERGVWVCFTYGESWRHLSDFVFGELGRRLVHRLGDTIDVCLRITGTFGNVRAHMIIPYDYLKAVIEIIEELSGELHPKPKGG